MKKSCNTLYYIVFFLFLFFINVGEATSADYNIDILTPVEGQEIADYMVISVDITKNDKPFLETSGSNIWVTAVIKDSRGVDSLRISLRDNVEDEDSKPNDRIWTSLAKVRLPDGKYKISSIILNDGNEKFSLPQEIKFSVKTKLPSAVKETERDDALKDALRGILRDADILKKDDVLAVSREIISKLDMSFNVLALVQFDDKA